jgi:hypothetical protein
MAEAFGIACHELVSLDFRCGSTTDSTDTPAIRPLLRGKRTSDVCFQRQIQCSAFESAVGGRADILRLA